MSLSALLLFGVLCGCQTGARSDNGEHIAAIEAKLPPAIALAGQPAQGRSLADSMDALDVPGVSIAMIRDGRIAWTRQYGVTTSGGAPVDAETRFQAGSVSKPITALGALALVREGRATLDDDVNARLTRWRLGFEDGITGAVSLGALLSHTAGVNAPGFPGYRTDAAIPSLLQVLGGAPPANTVVIRVISPPGARWAYSGGGYEVAQLLIEDVSDAPFSAWMKTRVFEPLGMSHSGYEQRLSPESRRLYAMGHDATGAKIAAGPHIYPEQAAAGLWSTPSDLALALIWIQQTLEGAHGAESQALMRRMLSEVKSGRAMGFDVGGADGARWFSKSGDTEGFGALFAAYECGDGVVVMTNGAAGPALTRDIVRAIAAAYNWPDYGTRVRTETRLDYAAAERLVGRYRYRAGEFTVSLRDGVLYIASPGQDPERAYAASGSELFVLSEDASWIFDLGESPTQSGNVVLGRTILPFQRE